METKLTYRVILEFGYHESYFEFEDRVRALSFAEIALVHAVPCEDNPEKPFKVVLEVVDKDLEKEMVENE